MPRLPRIRRSPERPRDTISAERFGESPQARKAFIAVTRAGVPPKRYATSTASRISASKAPAPRARLAMAVTPSGVGLQSVDDHGHEVLVLRRDGTVAQNVFALGHVGADEFGVALLQRLDPRRQSGLRHWGAPPRSVGARHGPGATADGYPGHGTRRRPSMTGTTPPPTRSSLIRPPRIAILMWTKLWRPILAPCSLTMSTAGAGVTSPRVSR